MLAGIHYDSERISKDREKKKPSFYWCQRRRKLLEKYQDLGVYTLIDRQYETYKGHIKSSNLEMNSFPVNKNTTKVFRLNCTGVIFQNKQGGGGGWNYHVCRYYFVTKSYHPPPPQICGNVIYHVNVCIWCFQIDLSISEKYLTF